MFNLAARKFQFNQTFGAIKNKEILSSVLNLEEYNKEDEVITFKIYDDPIVRFSEEYNVENLLNFFHVVKYKLLHPFDKYSIEQMFF